jgi:pyrroline-5-carboxylate reductase
MEKDSVGFIGAGNMAKALIKGLITAGLYDPSGIKASDRLGEALQTSAAEYGIETFDDNRALVKKCNTIVLAVKPQVISEVLNEIGSEVGDSHLIISIVAGIPIAAIQTKLGRESSIIRVMPNTPALIQKGISALCGGEYVSAEQLKQAEKIFAAVGETLIVPEKMMDAITALSASGPGFIFKIMEGFVKGGESLGFDHGTASKLVKQTFLGAAHLAWESEKTLGQLREMVTSKGGTTAAGLAVFDKRASEEIIQEVLRAAYERSLELGKSSS